MEVAEPGGGEMGARGPVPKTAFEPGLKAGAEALGRHRKGGRWWALSQGNSWGEGETQAQVRWELVSCSGAFTNTLTHLHTHTPEPHRFTRSCAHRTCTHTWALVRRDSHPYTFAHSRPDTHTCTHPSM